MVLFLHNCRYQINIHRMRKKQNVLIKPNRISFSSQIQRQFFFHDKSLFFGHWFQIDVIVKAGAQIGSIFLNDVS